MSPKAEYQQLMLCHTLSKRAYRHKDSTRHEVGQVKAILLCTCCCTCVQHQKDFPWITYLSLYYNFHHDWDFRTAVKTHLISLSSRNASFFCFLMSSRLRRASARSLTARSRSRRRLSHRVLGKERRREVY